MAIADIAAANRGQRGGPPRCCVCNAIDDLPESESKALVELLSNPKIRYTTLSEALRADPDNPLDISYEAIRKHVRGRCAARTVLRQASQ